jgi:hypothetical protein
VNGLLDGIDAIVLSLIAHGLNTLEGSVALTEAGVVVLRGSRFR